MIEPTLATRAAIYWRSARALNLPDVPPEDRASAAANMRYFAVGRGPVAERAARLVSKIDQIKLYGGPDDAA